MFVLRISNNNGYQNFKAGAYAGWYIFGNNNYLQHCRQYWLYYFDYVSWCIFYKKMVPLWVPTSTAYLYSYVCLQLFCVSFLEFTINISVVYSWTWRFSLGTAICESGMIYHMPYISSKRKGLQSDHAT